MPQLPLSGAFENDTGAPISGKTRSSLFVKPTRTFTMAFARSAVGTMAMTDPSNVASG
jgi:hypothetical protein